MMVSCTGCRKAGYLDCVMVTLMVQKAVMDNMMAIWKASNLAISWEPEMASCSVSLMACCWESDLMMQGSVVQTNQSRVTERDLLGRADATLTPHEME
eukprot:CAMPEP_0116028156 /NCGR_PEP_ID=MMETSP0321-20121206/15203_1 /TAXON_ID=163516 /ORGANISM="Leptocylindrus danicus var. danicus, Strain B650" /LENGTH=97 /DNA_ID=CAMNT_0003501941 /DNA_START=104 /DNA_END=397 /DNA_ORIENTATION=-